MWAQIIRLGKHESTDDPPDKPFWRGRKRQQDVSCLSLSPKRASFRPDVSPSKDQLTKWHNGIILVSAVLCLMKSTKNSGRKFSEILNICHN